MPSKNAKGRGGKKGTARASRKGESKGLQHLQARPTAAHIASAQKGAKQAVKDRVDEALDQPVVAPVSGPIGPVAIESPDDSAPADPHQRLSEATLNRISKSEVRAIAISRGYWKPDDQEATMGGRGLVAAFLAKQKPDKRTVGKEI
jgi:hypothetical protein